MVMTKYLTKWAEAQPMKNFNATANAKFIFEYIMFSFGFPNILMSNMGSHFLNETIVSLLEEF